MEEPNNDIDTETLQAQIDLAMAHTQNLIASWLPASSGSLTQSSSSRPAETEAELQVLLRRPPRLGVGAPLPETHAPAQARLVQKLQGKKHAQKTANGTHVDVAGVKNKEDDDKESSAEESRIGTTRKRTIIDPFEAAGKKRKKRQKEAEGIKVAITDETAQAAPQMVGDERTMSVFGATAGPAAKKKKKKKKKSLLLEGQGIVEDDGEPRSANTHHVIVAQNEGPLTQTPLDTWEGKKPLQQDFWDGAAEAADTDQHLVTAPDIGTTVTVPTSPGQSPTGLPVQRSPTGVTSTRDATLLPVLNLTGPPSMAPEDTESSPRRRRRRRRKKKKLEGDLP